MELMRQSWSDERLDDLKDEVVRQGARIDALSDRIDAQGDRLSKRIDAQTERIDAQSERIDTHSERIDSMGERIEGVHQAILTVGGRIFAGCIAVAVAVVGLIATQL